MRNTDIKKNRQADLALVVTYFQGAIQQHNFRTFSQEIWFSNNEQSSRVSEGIYFSIVGCREQGQDTLEESSTETWRFCD